jgi:hypothetical protein
MLDIPEAVIILLTAVLVVLATRHWISTIALDRTHANNDKGN